MPSPRSEGKKRGPRRYLGPNNTTEPRRGSATSASGESHTTRIDVDSNSPDKGRSRLTKKGNQKTRIPGPVIRGGLACISLDDKPTCQCQVRPGTEKPDRHTNSVLSSPLGGRGGGTRLAWRETQATCPP